MAISNAPTSHAAPPGRGTPRWSVAGQPAPSPPSIAGLPAWRAIVWVGPPLPARGPSSGFVPARSPTAPSEHVPASSMLCPSEPIDPAQLAPAAALPPATIVFFSVTVPPTALMFPPVAAEPPASVSLTRLAPWGRASSSVPPLPSPSARLPANVSFTSVTPPESSASMAPPTPTPLNVPGPVRPPAWLPVNVLLVTESAPASISMAPPAP